jgi:hypothetical protein
VEVTLRCLLKREAEWCKIWADEKSVEEGVGRLGRGNLAGGVQAEGAESLAVGRAGRVRGLVVLVSSQGSC